MMHNYSIARRGISVLMVTYSYYPVASGGAERQAQILAERLARRGVTVGVVTIRYPGTHKFEIINGVSVWRLSALLMPGLASLTFLPNLFLFLLKHGADFDVLHVHQAYYSAALGRTATWLLGKRLVVKAACSGEYGDMARLDKARGAVIVSEILRHADRVVSLTDALTDELLSHGFPESRICRIPNGVDTKAFFSREPKAQIRQRLGIPDSKTALFVGRTVPEKGVDILLKAWRLVLDSFPSACLIILGEGDYLSTYRSAAIELRVDQSVRFFGKVENVVDYLSAVDVFVLPSLSEGMSNAILEAMACGVPVIASNVSGMDELIEDGLNGLLVRVADANETADAIMRLFNNQKLSLKLTSNATQRVHEEFDMDSVVEKYLKLYHELTNVKSRS